jgi:hypothetical protein
MLDPRDSTTYQAILRKGREQGWAQAREDARLTGGKRFLIRVGTKGDFGISLKFSRQRADAASLF